MEGGQRDLYIQNKLETFEDALWKLMLEKDNDETKLKLRVLSLCATDVMNAYILAPGSLDIERTVDF